MLWIPGWMIKSRFLLDLQVFIISILYTFTPLSNEINFLMMKTYDSSFDYFESLFHNTVENTVLLMDKEGTIMSINQAFSNSFGYEPRDIIGRNVAILFTEEDQMKGMPEKELSTVLANGQASDNNYLVSKDKTITWVSGESILVKNAEGEIRILKIIQNIHQQKITETSLQRLNEFNENILSSIEDVVIVLDDDMNVIKANRAFSKIFKYNKED